MKRACSQNAEDDWPPENDRVAALAFSRLETDPRVALYFPEGVGDYRVAKGERGFQELNRVRGFGEGLADPPAQALTAPRSRRERDAQPPLVGFCHNREISTALQCCEAELRRAFVTIWMRGNQGPHRVVGLGAQLVRVGLRERNLPQFLG